MILFDHVILVNRQRSDSIKMFMVGPFVDGLCSIFEDIDRVRAEGGFNVPFVGVFAKEDGASL